MKNKLINCLIQKSNIQVTFTEQQWRDYKENKTNLLAVKLNRDFNINPLQNLNTFQFNIDTLKYKKIIVFGMTLTLLIISSNIKTYASINTDGIDRLGKTFVDLIQLAGYWLCFSKGLIDIIKEVLKGGDKAEGIAKILINYTLAFASFYLLPTLFDLIKTSLS